MSGEYRPHQDEEGEDLDVDDIDVITEPPDSVVSFDQDLELEDPKFSGNGESRWNGEFWKASALRLLRIVLGVASFLSLVSFFSVVVTSMPLKHCTLLYYIMIALAVLQLVIAMLYGFHQIREIRPTLGRLLGKKGNPIASSESEVEMTTLSPPSSPTRVDPSPLLDYDDESSAITKSWLRRCCTVSCWLSSATLLLTLLLFVVVFLFISVRDSSLPQEAGVIKFEGMHSQATIHRDDHGVIHIKAENEHDLFFAQGVACAQERLWQMELQRRVGAGTLAEVVGAGGLPVDKEFRTLGVYKAAKGDVQYLSKHYPDEFALLLAYIHGINSYLETNPNLPLEFRLLELKPAPWVAEDVIVWEKLMSLDLSMNFGEEKERLRLNISQSLTRERIAQLWPDYPKDAPTILSTPYPTKPPKEARSYDAKNDQKIQNVSPKFWDDFADYHKMTPIKEEQRIFSEAVNEGIEGSEATGWKERLTSNILKQRRDGHFSMISSNGARASNNWVVSGNRTATGLPMVANDPHLDLSIPSIWILMHLSCDSFEAIGATFAGMPGIIIGRNRDIAWAVTNVGADVQDLYVLIPSPKNSNQYLYNNQSYSYVTRTETIKIKGQEDYLLEVKETVFGPVVSSIFSFPVKEDVALRWVSLDGNDTTYLSFLGVNKAKSFQDFQHALSFYIAPAQNFMFADRSGNIGYQCPGKIPIRRNGHTGLYPVTSTSDSDWKGFIPFSKLPYAFNPPEGFIVSANAKVVNNYEYLILGEPDWEEPYRTERIRELIISKSSNGSKISVESMAEIQNDVTTLLFRDLKPFINLLSVHSQRDIEWQQKLLLWDGNELTTSEEAFVFEEWYTLLTQLGESETGRRWDRPIYIINSLKGGDIACNNYSESTGQQACLDFASTMFSSAIDNYLKESSKKWGQKHIIKFEHPILSDTPLGCFFDRQVQHGGDDYTVNVGGYNKNFEQGEGPSYRQIVDLADLKRNSSNDAPYTPRSRFVHPMGQSGNVFSEHYDDLLPLWTNGEYLPMITEGYGIKTTLQLEPLD